MNKRNLYNMKLVIQFNEFITDKGAFYTWKVIKNKKIGLHVHSKDCELILNQQNIFCYQDNVIKEGDLLSLKEKTALEDLVTNFNSVK